MTDSWWFFTNPFEKYAKVKLEIISSSRGENKNYLKPPPSNECPRTCVLRFFKHWCRINSSKEHIFPGHRKKPAAESLLADPNRSNHSPPAFDSWQSQVSAAQRPSSTSGVHSLPASDLIWQTNFMAEKWYISGIFPANWGMDYATYHLLGEPETTIEEFQHFFLFFWKFHRLMKTRFVLDGIGIKTHS